MSTPHFGASIHAKPFENSESCLLSPKLAATHISSISPSGGACTIPTNLHCKSEKTEVILKSIECQKKQERDPPKWPRVTKKMDTPKEMQTTTTCSSISQTARHITSSRFLMLSWLLRTLQAIQTHAAMASCAINFWRKLSQNNSRYLTKYPFYLS